MAATAVAKPTPYFGPARTKLVLFASAITDQTTGVPTRAEIDAGSELSAAMGGPGLEGGQSSATSQDVPNWSSLDQDKIPGFNSLSDLTITFNADQAGADPRTAFAKGATVNFARMDTGDVPTRKMTTYFATVASKDLQIPSSGPAQYVIGLIPNKPPFRDVTIPS